MLRANGVEVIFDPYSKADQFETVVRANLMGNIGITFPAAFSAVYQN
jgi:hypothetical protein